MAILTFLLAAAPATPLRAQEDPACAAETEQAAPDPSPAPVAARQETPPPPAEQVAGTSVGAALKEEVKRYGRDSVAIVKAPLAWKAKDWEKAGGAVLIVGGLMFADRDIDKAAQKQRSSFTNHISSWTAPLGSGYGFAISGGLFGAGLVFHHENLRDTGREAIEAGLLAIAVDQVLKRTFGRERIADSGGRTVFVPGSSHDSFPSGHTTEAFAVASVIATRSKGWEIPVLAYGAAALVAMDRINTRDHFASDVVAGAFLGTTVGRFLVKRHGAEKAGVLSKADLEIIPIHNGLAARIKM